MVFTARILVPMGSPEVMGIWKIFKSQSVENLSWKGVFLHFRSERNYSFRREINIEDGDETKVFSPINESIDSGLQSSSRSKSCFRGIQAQSYQTKLPNIVVSCLQSSLINIGVCWGGSIVTCQNLSKESGFLCQKRPFYLKSLDEQWPSYLPLVA